VDTGRSILPGFCEHPALRRSDVRQVTTPASRYYSRRAEMLTDDFDSVSRCGRRVARRR
jgi:hypothetical protein